MAPPRKELSIAVLFVAQMLAIGTTSFGYGLFVQPLSEAYDLSRADANSGLIFIIVGMAIWSPLVGRALDVLPVRQVIVGGALVFGGGLLVAAWSHSALATAAAAFTLIAGGAAVLGPLSGSTLAARWFTTHRGRALGIIAISSSMGGFVVVPLLGWLIAAFGWRGALTITGLSVAVLVTILAMLFLPGGASGRVAGGKEHSSSPDRQFTARQLLATRDLWLLVFVVGTMFAISQALLSALVPHAGDQGIDLARAAWLVSAASISSMLGKFAIGSLADRVDLRWLQIFVVAMMAAFLCVLGLGLGYPALLGACLLAGIAIGGTTPLWAAFVAMRFGASSVGMVMGLMVFLQMPIIFGALRLTGAMFDRTGSYDAAFLSFLAILPLVALAVLPLRRPAPMADAGLARGAPPS